jgi:hypothetical protein
VDASGVDGKAYSVLTILVRNFFTKKERALFARAIM